MTVPANPSASFMVRTGQVFSHSDNVVEGAFWGSWCLYSAWNWTKSLGGSAEESQAGVEKAQNLWQANKKFTLSSLSLASGVSMVATWAHEVKLIPMGSFSQVVNTIGYGASGIVSGVELVDELRLFFEKGAEIYRSSFTALVNSREERGKVYSMLSQIVKVALYVSLTAWGLFGAAYATFGGVTLFVAQDTAYCYVLLTLLGYIASELVTGLAKKVL